MDESGSSEPGDKRGRARDAEATREAILDAGEQVFAEHGFDGARIDAIAEASGYNKSMIFQYFEDKLGLYAAVIRRADDQMRVWQVDALARLQTVEANMGADQVEDLLRDYVGWYFDYLVQHPSILRIFNWELAEGWQTFSEIISERDMADIDNFAPVLRRLQREGLMRPEPTGFLQVTSAFFTSHVLLAIVPLYRVMLPGEDLDSPAAVKKMRDFATDFIVRGLCVGPATGKQSRPGRRSEGPARQKNPRKVRSGL